MGAPLGEFDLIARYFTRPVPAGRADIPLAVGDDCALLQPATGEQWAVSTDTLVEGTHFLPTVDPAALGHKALAVNLSDLAACGAEPRCFFLALALPAIDEAWLHAFSTGMFALADAHGCVLAGGDTTRSPRGVVITITVMGAVPRGQALLRSGARPGDELWVSGTLGDAAFGLAVRLGDSKAADDAVKGIDRLERPRPQIALGRALRGVASGAIDVSDGLLGDLGHIIERSDVGARVEWNRVPRSPELRRQPEADQRRWALAGGDDYELLFTAPLGHRADVERAAREAGVAVSRIGEITSTGRLELVDADGRAMDTEARAFDHFRP
ncbi:MAG TPA: thiamine-phosphate kinase [Gemmatimonadaceae bacterium]|nr:thiamine-phosphate kinase [Gemmatimonadaceae bacterium]